MPSPKLFIFDWDGTLMDSERQIVQCMQLAAADVALAVPSSDAVRDIIGLGLPEAIAVLFPAASESIREHIRDAYAHHFVQESGGRSELFAGAHELLSGLQARGASLAIATGKSRRGLSRVLEGAGLAHYFHATRCADETASKPDPRMLHELLRHFSVSAREAVMIGDTSFDMDMAARIEMPRIAMTHGVHSEAVLARYQPIAIVPDLYALARTLAAL